MIVEEWPVIKNEIDSGRLAPLALIRVKSYNAGDMGKNHQVLAYAYALSGNDLKIYVYDPNYPKNDKVTISLNISDPHHTTQVTYSTKEPMWGYFVTGYGYRQPPAFPIPATKLAGDFNNDGKTDVALTGGQGWGSLPVAFSDGTGGFNVTNNAITNFATWASDRRSKKLVGDFDYDGKADVVLTGPGYWRSLPTAMSQGIGSFTVSNSWVGDFAIWSSNIEVKRLVGDFNGDGRADIALTGPSEWGSVPIAFSNGDGSFYVTNWLTPGSFGLRSSLASERVTGRFNNDALTDIALRPFGSGTSLTIAYANGNGTFNVVNQSIGTFGRDVFDTAQAMLLKGDFTGDGLTDLALTGPLGWATIPLASPTPSGFTVTNGWVGDFALWASVPIL